MACGLHGVDGAASTDADRDVGAGVLDRRDEAVDLTLGGVAAEGLADHRQPRSLEGRPHLLFHDAPDDVVRDDDRGRADRRRELSEPGDRALRLDVASGADDCADGNC